MSKACSSSPALATYKHASFGTDAKMWGSGWESHGDFGDDDGFSTGRQAAGTQLCCAVCGKGAIVSGVRQPTSSGAAFVATLAMLHLQCYTLP